MARLREMATLDVFGDTAPACAALAQKEPTLARALAAIEKPHVRRRDGGFAGLFRIIVEQQVSVQSAQAIWGRCRERFDPLTPHLVSQCGAAALKAQGLSGPKTRYVLGLCDNIANGDLDLDALAAMENAAALIALQKVKGVGPWTAAIYLLFCEGRSDIWPPNDVALKHAYNAAKSRRPDYDQRTLDERAARWAPYRGVAAHILWTFYAHLRGRTPL